MMRNHTAITTFTILGFTSDPQLQILIFLYVSTSYILSVLGNLIIISLILVDSHLKTAMYFFLQNFSLLEVLMTTVCIPRYLHILSTRDRTITVKACFSQVFFVVLFATTEFFFLAIMSYDCYVAICKPLHYMIIMHNKICRILVLCCWVLALFIIFPPLGLSLHLEFCDSVIDRFYCDASPILKNACSDTWFIEQLVVVSAVLTFIMNLVCIVLTYVFIIRTILRLPSAHQRKKAFYTCSSHMIVVSMTYGSCIFIYIKPSAKEAVAINKVVSLLPTSVAPLLNPFIYTLRNKQVKQSFNDILKRLAFLSKK